MDASIKVNPLHGPISLREHAAVRAATPTSAERRIEQFEGILEIDRVRNRVVFIEKDCEYPLPLAPLDIDIAKSTSKYGKKNSQ